jgi:hypothetical protein
MPCSGRRALVVIHRRNDILLLGREEEVEVNLLVEGDLVVQPDRTPMFW